MAVDKALLSGSTSLLLLKLLEEGDMYGYQMVELLRERSDSTFDLKAGTLYPLLHALEQKGLVESWEQQASVGRPRRYYRLTQAGRKHLEVKESEWRAYAKAVLQVLEGGAGNAAAERSGHAPGFALCGLPVRG